MFGICLMAFSKNNSRIKNIDGTDFSQLRPSFKISEFSLYYYKLEKISV